MLRVICRHLKEDFQSDWASRPGGFMRNGTIASSFDVCSATTSG